MTELSTIDLFGFWLGIFLTFCILSFLYKDNPFYKIAEHLFIGISIGYVVIQQYYNVLRPELIEPLDSTPIFSLSFIWLLIPIAMVIAMFVKAISERWSWVGRYPLAFVVALYAGLQINGVAQADLGSQAKRGLASVDAKRVNINKASAKKLATLPGVNPSIAKKIVERRKQKPFESVGEVEKMVTLTNVEKELLSDGRGPIQGLDAQAAVKDGQRYWFGIFSKLLLLLGLIASLIYFYFSVEHKGAIGKVSRFGVWVLMIGFGASFGYTVQGRISLAIGRAQNVRGDTLPSAWAEQIHGPLVALLSVIVIVAGIVWFELRDRKRND